MRRRFTSAEMAGARLWWVASFDFGGRTWRVGSGALSIISTALGRDLAIPAGLSGATAEMVAPWMGRAPERRTGQFTLVVPGLDVGAALAARYELDGQPAEVAIWREGDIWEERLVVLSGQVIDYEYGAPGDAIKITIQESIDLDRAQIPEMGASVSPATHPWAAGGTTGLAYPWILGAPGSDGTQASPVIFVRSILAGGDRDLLLVAGHPVSATSITIADGTTNDSVHYVRKADGTSVGVTSSIPVTESLRIQHIEDGLGRLVAVVDLADAVTIGNDVSLKYTAAWTGGSGLVSVSGESADGAGSILEALLAHSTLPVDRGALSTVRDRLDAWKIGAMVQAPLAPMAWAVQALLPLLPVAVLTGPSGWRVIPVLLQPTRRDCVGTLTAGPACQRIGKAHREGQDEIANRLELRIAVDVVSGNTQRSAIVAADYDGTTHPNLLTRLSFDLYRSRSWSDETVAVYDDVTAIRTVRWRSAAYAFPRTVIQYAVPQYQWLQPGDLVWLIDDKLSIERPVWVQRVLLTPGGAIVDLVAWRLNA